MKLFQTKDKLKKLKRVKCLLRFKVAEQKSIAATNVNSWEWHVVAVGVSKGYKPHTA